MITLLSASANATGATTLFNGPLNEAMWLIAYGTWNSATAKLQYSPDAGTTWIDVTDASFTANGIVRLFLCGGHIRGVLSGGGGSESVTLELRNG